MCVCVYVYMYMCAYVHNEKVNMSDGQKYPFNIALSEMLGRKTTDNNALGGRLLPAHVVAVKGQIVTVKFDVLPEQGVVYPSVTVPVATFPYIRYPIQVGDKGVTLCAEVSLANQCGLGQGLPSRATPPSMAALYFIPIAHVNYHEVDPNKITLYGPDGAILRTEGFESSITVDKTSITQKSPDNIDIESTEIRLEAADIYLTGNIWLQGPIQQLAGGGATTAKLIGPLDVDNETSAKDFSTPSVKSVNGHEHNVENVQSGGATKKSTKPIG